MSPANSLDLDHESRISVLEAQAKARDKFEERVVKELDSMRRAIWFVGVAVLLNAGSGPLTKLLAHLP